MKVTAFVGSARKKFTYNAVEKFLKNLQSLGEVDCEIISLSDYNLKICKGCKLCFEKGKEFCPLKDDRDILFEKIYNSDGVLFASPNYSFHVSGSMKVFLDRFGFIFHRPCFFGKVYSGMVIQAFYGGSKIAKYFDFVGNGLGFNVVKSSCLNALDPMTDKEQKKLDTLIDKHSRKFYSQLIKKEYPEPTFFKLMGFRMARTSMNLMLGDGDKDYEYYQDNGWFKSDYYYPVKLNPAKKLTGIFYDKLFYYIYSKKQKVC